MEFLDHGINFIDNEIEISLEGICDGLWRH